MQTEYEKLTARAVPFLRVITLGIILAFLYFASSVVVTLLLSILLAYFLDPVVEFLERWYVPRGLGALLVLLAVTVLLAGLGYLTVVRARQFAADWPRYSAILRRATTAVDQKLVAVEKEVVAISPQPQTEAPPPQATQTNQFRDWLFLGLGSLYSSLLDAAFMPFLVFFMLAAKPQIWKVTMELFPSGQRTRVKEALDEVNSILRTYLAGNALVALILMIASSIFFLVIHLDYPFLLGSVSGVLNLVPYLGAVLAWVPPFLIGMTKWDTVGPYLGVAVALLIIHIIALNFLMPAMIGRRMHLNPLAVTISLLLWGWLWGGIGLLLAIPITATVKVICDHAEGWGPAGRWLGA